MQPLYNFRFADSLIRPPSGRPPEGELPVGQEKPPWGVPQGKALGAPAPVPDKWQFVPRCCRARPVVWRLPHRLSLELGAGTARLPAKWQFDRGTGKAAPCGAVEILI